MEAGSTQHNMDPANGTTVVGIPVDKEGRNGLGTVGYQTKLYEWTGDGP